MASTYREIAPCPALRPWVECFWVKSVAPEPGAPERTRVVPDGSVDIIVEASGSSGIVGAMRRPKLIRHHAAIELVAVRFRPGGAEPFLRVPMHELADRRVSLDEIGLSGGDALAARVAEARTATEGARALEAGLCQHLDRIGPPDATVSAAARSIAASGGRGRIEDLTAELGVGRRRLGRLFDRHVGVTPKQLCRIVRIQRTLRRIDRARHQERRPAPAPDWVDLAVDCGFYDQAHLVREFRDLTGTTPTGWLHR